MLPVPGPKLVPQFGHARSLAAAAQLLLDARRSVASGQLREDRRHQHIELLLLERAPRWPARRVGVMPGAGEPERPAHQRLRVVRLLRLDELEAHFPLPAKKAAAYRRNSHRLFWHQRVAHLAGSPVQMVNEALLIALLV